MPAMPVVPPHRPLAASSSRPRAARLAAALLVSLAACARRAQRPGARLRSGGQPRLRQRQPGDRRRRRRRGRRRAPSLLAGWSYREFESRSERSFRWGLEPHSELSFTVHEPRGITLRLEARPRKAAGRRSAGRRGGDQRSTGRRAGAAGGATTYELEVAADLLRARRATGCGCATTWARRAAIAAAEDRALAVAWYRIGFDGLRQPDAEPRLDAERDLLFIPYGSQIDYFLEAPAGAVLRSARRRLVGGDGTLTVHLDSDDADEQRLATVGGDGDLELALPATVGEPIRLSLAAMATGPAGDGGGIVLEAPAVWAETPPATVPPPAPAVAGDGARHNVIVYLVDTLRADHLGCYGQDRGVSPRIDGFAAGATLFENARANAPWTLPAVASVMTGLWPPAHGVFEDTRRLVPEAVTLAETLRDAGYQTAAVVTNGFATEAYGLDQGFDELTLIKTARRKSSRVHEEAVAWLETRDPERPFFLYLHTIDPHKPYLPTDELRRQFAPEADAIWRQIVANPAKQRWPPSDHVVAQLLALYDAEIAENDASFGDTLDALQTAGLYDDALIVFLSDHGEEFHEHGAWTHASNLFREVLNVPLIVKLPGQREGRRVAELAQQIDLMPTLLTYLGVDGPATQGRLLPALLRPAEAAPRRVFSHTKRKSQTTASVIDGDWKLIRRVDDKGITSRLYNWRQDPRELADRLAERPTLTGPAGRRPGAPSGRQPAAGGRRRHPGRRRPGQPTGPRLHRLRRGRPAAATGCSRDRAAPRPRSRASSSSTGGATGSQAISSRSAANESKRRGATRDRSSRAWRSACRSNNSRRASSTPRTLIDRQRSSSLNPTAFGESQPSVDRPSRCGSGPPAGSSMVRRDQLVPTSSSVSGSPSMVIARVRGR